MSLRELFLNKKSPSGLFFGIIFTISQPKIVYNYTEVSDKEGRYVNS